MIPLRPRSLFGRLTLVLLAGLIVVQLISTAIVLRDRGAALHQSLREDTVLRIANIVHLLDGLAPAERERLLPALTTSTLRIAFAQSASPPRQEASAADASARLVRAELADALSEGHRVRVAVGESGTLPMSMAGHQRMMMNPSQMSEFMQSVQSLAGAFHIEVRLLDGTWVRFDREVPQELIAWPSRLLLTLLVLLVGVLLIALLAVRWLTRPLRVLADAADGLGRDIRRPPLPLEGPREVMHAARAFNTMQERIARFIEDRGRILAAVSHDLKTPITRLRLRSELLDDEAVRHKFTQDLDDMEHMVTATLDFMRGAELREESQPVDITALLESIQEDVREAGGEVTVDGAAARPYPGKPLALKRCFSNLVENAVRYGGRARILIADGEGELRVAVQDDGPGITESELERIFEPFQRLEGSRNQHTGGTGLGLGIARNIARAHGGDVTLHNREQGGLEARVVLPRRST